MHWGLPALLAGMLAAAALSLGGGDDKKPKEKPPEFVKDVRPLLKKYCYECHSSTKRKGGLDLERLDTEAAALAHPDLWAEMGARVEGLEMPPPKSKQLTEAERKLVEGWVRRVAESQVDYDKLTRAELEPLLAAEPMSRRLSRTEYNNTLRDLLGLDLQPGDLLPSEGGGGEGFDNAGATLFTTPVLLEQYLEAAELVLGTLLPPVGTKPPPKLADRVRWELARRTLLVVTPSADVKPRDAVRKVLEAFLPRAFRRPATPSEVDRYLSIFDKATGRGDSYEQALKLALKGVLISPSFLFLVEEPAETKGLFRLSQYEMASHLSYFLWASMPDAALLDLAAQGKLHDEKVLHEQVRRMTRDPKARGFADSFALQWLGLRPLGTTTRPDARTFPEFDDELLAAMREETVLFFDAIVRENRSVLEVVHADYTFLNERLAKHYKIDGVKGPQMRRVSLSDPARGGVLGHAGILTVTSFPHRTSPVLRGRWILEELLGGEVPPPPPDVPVLNERQKGAEALTLRQQLEKHRTKAECSACHSRMDPLGFGLENFDALGRWRTEQGGKPIESAGVLPTGEKFAGAAELKKLLLDKRRPDFLRNLCRRALGYALGRQIRGADFRVVKDCVQALEQGEFRSTALLEAVVLSYPFTHRNQKK